MIELIVCSIGRLFDETSCDPNEFVISIVSPGMDHSFISGDNVHKYQFYDIDMELLIEKQNRIIRPMEKEIAESIVDVAFNNRDKKRWIIHCEAGVSRSPAVALGLAPFIEMNYSVKQLEKMFPWHNRHVRSLVYKFAEQKSKSV